MARCPAPVPSARPPRRLHTASQPPIYHLPLVSTQGSVHRPPVCAHMCICPSSASSTARSPNHVRTNFGVLNSPAVPRSPRTRESARITVTPSSHPGVLPGYSHLCVPRATCWSGRRSDLQLSPCPRHSGDEGSQLRVTAPEGSGAGVCGSLSEPGCVLPSSGQRLW